MACGQLHYLEIVTPDVDDTCAIYARLHGVSFSAPVEELGQARTAPMPWGGTVGIRSPMHSAEEPVTRPYLRVADIEAACSAAVEAGGVIVVPSMEIPGGRGKCAIFQQGSVQHGLRQL